MTILTINTGSSPNAGDGDTLRTAFNKINYNFAQTVTYPYLGDFTFNGSTLTNANYQENITIQPNAAGLNIATTASFTQPIPPSGPYINVTSLTTQTVTVGTGTDTVVINTQTTLFSIDYSGDVSLTGQLTAGNGLSVTGQTTLEGTVLIGAGNLYVGGAISNSGPIQSQGVVHSIQGFDIGGQLVNHLGSTIYAQTGTLFLHPATTTSTGVVGIGYNVQVDSTGFIGVSTATTTQLGVVSAGRNLSISEGIISVNSATTTVPGVVEIGTNINVSNGLISVNTGSTTTVGLVQVGSNINVDDYGVISIGTATSTSTGVIKAGSGITMDGDGTLNVIPIPGSLTVSQLTTVTTTSTSTTSITNNVFNVTELLFDTEAGFTVSEYSTGTALVSMNSTFKYWEVDGQQTLIANGLDTMHFIAGPGIAIITSSTAHPQSIEFDVIPATTATLGGIIVGQGLQIDSTGTLSVANANALGDLLVNQTTLYANTLTLGVKIESVNGSSYVSVPSVWTDSNGTINNNEPAIISGVNGTLITTPAGSTGEIIVAPNDGTPYDTTEQGSVSIFSFGTGTTAGVYIATDPTLVSMFPNTDLPALISTGGTPTGVFDVTTRAGDISFTPWSGTGTVHINGTLSVTKLSVLEGSSAALTTDYPTAAAGGLVNSGNYSGVLTPLNPSVNVHKLDSGDFYLANGSEGQLVYFVPTNAGQNGNNTIVWLDSVRSFSGGNATVTTARAWNPFAGDNTQGMASAIFTDGAWNITNNLLT